MSSQKFSFAVPYPLGHLSSALAVDIVFAHRDSKNKIDFAFSVGHILRSVSITSTEIVKKDPQGFDAGTGLYKVAGGISLLPNDGTTLTQIQQHLGRRFEMAILYADGLAEFIPNGANNQAKDFSDATLTRYPNIEKLSGRFGVKLNVATARGGSARAWTLNISGLSTGSTFWKGTSQQFYSLFGPTLNQWLTDPSFGSPSTK